MPKHDCDDLNSAALVGLRQLSLPVVLVLASLLGTSPAADDLAEIKRFPPLEPEQALTTFQVANGFRLELVAAEPQVADPVDACFDENGRMYVVEMHGYPYSDEKRTQCPTGRGKPNAGVVRWLEDTDGNGVMDRSRVFADGISWPQSVCCYNGGVFVLAPPHLYYFEDTDDDGTADVRDIVYSGFSRANVQALANNMKWGLDNRIWAAGGRSGAELTHRGEKLFSLGSRDIRFNPKTEELTAVAGGAQFGHSFDDWGNRFVCSNSNHIQHIVTELEPLARNPLLSASGTVRSIAKEGAAAPVFRRSPAEPWRIVRTRRRAADPKYANRLPATELVPVGFFTSATGVTIYRGDAYPESYHGNAFIGDVGGNLIHRKALTPNGVSFVATRADQGKEFITSTDTWFRPVNFVNAPDGALYVLDMYRETIEHPFSIPEDIKSHLDLESGHDRGRIYRLAPPNWTPKRPKKLGGLSSAELVAELESPNAWNRETAQRLLWERQDTSIVDALRQRLVASQSAVGRLHILWTLEGLGSLDVTTLRSALRDGHAAVREHAVRIAGRQCEALHMDDWRPLLNDESVRVRRQLAFECGRKNFPHSSAAAILLTLAGDAKNGDIQTAVLASAPSHLDAIATLLTSAANGRPESNPPELPHDFDVNPWLPQFAEITAALGDDRQTLVYLAAAASADKQPDLQRRTLAAVAKGLTHRRSNLAKVLQSNAADGDVATLVRALFSRAAKVVTDQKQSLADRTVAASLLAFADDSAIRPLSELLSPAVPKSLQLAALDALAQHSDPVATATVFEHWGGFSPSIRDAAVKLLLSRTPATTALLDAVEHGSISRSDLTSAQQQALREHPVISIRRRAERLWKSDVTGDRRELVTEWQAALELEGDAERGREVFLKSCAQCHRAAGKGHAVGPDLVSVRNKSPADLLVAILDPNREWQPNFTSYNVLTTDGQVFSGLVVAETATSLTLRQPEAKETTVLRANVELMKSAGKSLMPVGVEKDITRQQLADVIAFVKSLDESP